MGGAVAHYSVTVNNKTSLPVSVVITLPDGEVNRTVAPDGTSTISGYRNGQFSVTVFLAGKDHDAYVQKLQALKDELTTARASASPKDFALIIQELSLVEDQLRTLAAAGMPSCHAELSSDKNEGIAAISDVRALLVPSCGVDSSEL
jgi:hypothetical protein